MTTGLGDFVEETNWALLQDPLQKLDLENVDFIHF